MRAIGAILLLAWVSAADDRLEKLLSRVSEEAEVFRRSATKAIGRETLQHKGRMAPPRIVWGGGASKPEPRYKVREIVSEYGFAGFQDNPEWLREFRQVTAVDGRNVLKGKRDARQALAEGMSSEDDRRRMSMLREFERYGQIGAATDFGQSILLFRRRELANCEFQIEREEFSGAQKTIVLSWRQTKEHDAARVYSGRKLERKLMSGLLWVREDGLPLKIRLGVESVENDLPVIHAAEIDYDLHRQGFLLPARMRYRKIAMAKSGEPLVLVENSATYGNWQLFQADAEIKFTPVDEGDPQPK